MDVRRALHLEASRCLDNDNQGYEGQEEETGDDPEPPRGHETRVCTGPLEVHVLQQ